MKRISRLWGQSEATAEIVGVGPVPGHVQISNHLHHARLSCPPAFTTVVFSSAYLEEVEIVGCEFFNFESRASVFRSCEFTECTFESGLLSHVPPSRFVGSRFARVDLRGIDPGTARFRACRFEDCDFRGWKGLAAEFVECTFRGSVRDVTFFGRPSGPWADLDRRRNEFRTNDFSKADLRGSTFVNGIDIHSQRWPDAREYVRVDDFGRNLKRARRRVRDIPRGDREPVERALASLASYYQHQDALFTHETDIADDAIRDKVWELLVPGRRRACEDS